MSLRRDTLRELSMGLSNPSGMGARDRRKVVPLRVEAVRFLHADINVASAMAALRFDLGKVRALIPIGFGIVVVRECIEPRSFGCSSSNDGIRHAHDCRRIHATA